MVGSCPSLGVRLHRQDVALEGNKCKGTDMYFNLERAHDQRLRSIGRVAVGVGIVSRPSAAAAAAARLRGPPKYELAV